MPFVPKNQEAWLRATIIWNFLAHHLEACSGKPCISNFKVHLKWYTSPLHNSSATAGQQSLTSPPKCWDVSAQRQKSGHIQEIELASFHITRKTISVDLDGLLWHPQLTWSFNLSDIALCLWPPLAATMGSDDFCHPLAFVKDKTGHNYGGLTICQPSC